MLAIPNKEILHFFKFYITISTASAVMMNTVCIRWGSVWHAVDGRHLVSDAIMSCITHQMEQGLAD